MTDAQQLKIEHECEVPHDGSIQHKWRCKICGQLWEVVGTGAVSHPQAKVFASSFLIVLMLAISQPTFASVGFAGINSQKCHSSISFLWSRCNTTISIATPIATSAVKPASQYSGDPDDLSKVAISLSKAHMALCKAEASRGRLENIQVKCAIITACLLFSLLGVRLSGLIVTFRRLRRSP